MGLEDESLAHFVREQFYEVTSADGRLWRTVKALLVPGKLTDEYVRGRRGLYVRPVRIFLVVNVVLFFYMSGNSGTILKGPLQTHYGATAYGSTAKALAGQRADRWGVDLEVVEAAFDARATAVAPTLIIVLIPALALAIGLVLWPLRRSGAVHLVLATHTVAGFMVAVIVLMTVMSLGFGILRAVGVDPGDSIDPVLVPTLIVSLVVYVGLSVHRVYETSRAWAAVSGSVIGVLGFAFAFWVYQAVLFAFTFWTLDPPA